MHWVNALSRSPWHSSVPAIKVVNKSSRLKGLHCLVDNSFAPVSSSLLVQLLVQWDWMSSAHWTASVRLCEEPRVKFYWWKERQKGFSGQYSSRALYTNLVTLTCEYQVGTTNWILSVQLVPMWHMEPPHWKQIIEYASPPESPSASFRAHRSCSSVMW